jgi:hypothetical protein
MNETITCVVESRLRTVSQDVTYPGNLLKGLGMLILHAIQDLALPLVHHQHSFRAQAGSN